MWNALIPRWQEPSLELAAFMHERVQRIGPGWRAALHLSNLQGIDFEKYPQLVPPLGARPLYESIVRGAGVTTQALAKYGGSGLIIWAPHEKEPMQRLAAAYLQYATHSREECQVQLLIPHDAYPDCDMPTKARDLWWHPLLGDRFASIVKTVEFLRQPARCVFSGSSGPLYHVKSLVVVTLAACKHAVPHSMLSWRNTLVSEVHGPIIWVDTDAKAELQTRRALAATKLAGLIRWEGPCRSFGTSPSSQRIYFRGYFDERWVTALTARLHVTTLKSQQSLGRALIGSQSLFTDPSALLAEISSVQAAKEIAPLCDEIVVVSSQLAILHTSCSKTLWEERLTELLQKSPDSSVDKLKWRPSRHGGRPWVKPITLDARAVRARALAAAREDKEAAVSAVVTIHGSLGAAPFALIQKVMDRIAESLGVILEPADPDNALRTYQWREFRDAADECTGAIKLTLSTPCEVQLLFARVRGAAVEVGGQQMFVEVQNLYQYMAALPPDLLTHTAASMRDVTAPRSTRGNAGGDRGIQAPLPPQ